MLLSIQISRIEINAWKCVYCDISHSLGSCDDDCWVLTGLVIRLAHHTSFPGVCFANCCFCHFVLFRLLKVEEIIENTFLLLTDNISEPAVKYSSICNLFLQ
jgi:hypothetical protein